MAAPRPLLPPRDLTLPAAGSTTAHDVLSRAVGRLLREIRPVVRAHAASSPEDAAAMDAVLAKLLRDEVAPLASMLRRPHAGALLRTLRATPPGEGGAILVELLGTLAFDLAHLGVLPRASPRSFALRRPPPRIVSLVARTSVPAPAEPLFHVVDGDVVLALADNNPLAMLDAHPDKRGNAIDLGGRPVREWVDALRQAFALVDAYLPELRDEMRLYVQAIVPVGFFADRHLSASYREAIGTLYLSLHPSPRTMVEALVHEFQHNKLNALLELDDVLENAQEPLYRSPVRPDARPLHGVLLAVHAFAPVAVLYERMIASGDERAGVRDRAGRADLQARWREVVRINAEGAAVLRAHARPTPIGRGLLDELLALTAVATARAGAAAPATG